MAFGDCVEFTYIVLVFSARRYASHEHGAVVAVTHGPKLDDLALMEVLRTRAFCNGALGSLQNHVKRRQRLLEFDGSPEEATPA